MTQANPLISLVLGVKNGLPMLRTAIDALRRQTYRRFELLVQDGGSTDGSLAYMHSIKDLPKLEIVSEPDTGIGQAYNRGLARCRGELIMLISCDEALDNDALQKGVDWFSNNPQAAVVCGAMRLANAEGRIVQVFIPPAFDFNKVLRNDVIPPICCTFFNRTRIGVDLYYDESLKTCPDYDLWIRLGDKFAPTDFVALPDPIVVARSDRASMSYRPESFEQFCKDKLFALNRYLDAYADSADCAALRRTASAGILTWAAENVLALEGVSESFLKWCAAAAKFDPSASRLLRLEKQTLAFAIEPSTGRFSLASDVQPDLPPGPTECANTLHGLEELHVLDNGQNATVERGDTVRVVTGRVPWTYTAEIPLRLSREMDRGRWYWARLNGRVLSGQIGVGILVENDIYNERLIGAEDGRTEVLIKISHPSARALMIRNGSFPVSSVFEVFGATVESFPRQEAPGSGLGTRALAPPQSSIVEKQFRMPTFSPAQAYWNHRTALAGARDRILALSRAVNHSSDLWPFQWAQLMSAVMDYEPDLVLELGRGKGNSTCAFNEASNLRRGRTRILSLCLSDNWERETVPRLRGIVPKTWFEPLRAVRADILDFNYEKALSGAKRVLIFWDAHGFEIAECVLGKILPLVSKLEHLVIMHDLSDTRYSSDEQLGYGGHGLWKGNNWSGPRLKLGIIDSAVEQSVAALDFATRNHLTLDSADHSFHTSLTPAQQAEMHIVLGDLFETQGHWFYFSLNERPEPYKFPSYTGPDARTKKGA